MDCGLPVVATRVGGIPEAVIHGETGLLVEPRDVEKLREAMERMLADGEFRMPAAQKALARARDVFDSTRNTAKLADALRALAEACPK